MLAASFDLVHEGQPYGGSLVILGIILGRCPDLLTHVLPQQPCEVSPLVLASGDRIVLSGEAFSGTAVHLGFPPDTCLPAWRCQAKRAGGARCNMPTGRLEWSPSDEAPCLAAAARGTSNWAQDLLPLQHHRLLRLTGTACLPVASPSPSALSLAGLQACCSPEPKPPASLQVLCSSRLARSTLQRMRTSSLSRCGGRTPAKSCWCWASWAPMRWGRGQAWGCPSVGVGDGPRSAAQAGRVPDPPVLQQAGVCRGVTSTFHVQVLIVCCKRKHSHLCRNWCKCSRC